MPIGIGIGLTPSFGGRVRTGAANLLGNEPSGFAVDWTDNTAILKRAGAIVAAGTANAQLVVTGTLTPGPTGASFDVSNNAYLDMSGFSDLTTYQATHTIFAEASVAAIDSVIKISVTFSDSVAGNSSALRHLTAANGASGIVISATATVANILPAAAPVANTFYKLGLGSQLDNYDAAWSGVAGTHDNLGAMPVGPIRCYFGSSFGAVTPLNGKIKRAMILPRKMTLAELQTKTT